MPTQLIRFGHSPDPDDAFMFYAFAKNKIPMQGFEVGHVIEDIESLNQRALGTGSFSAGKVACPQLEVTAVSCHAYAYLADQYLVMRSGASVGDNYGPILVGPGKGERVTGNAKPSLSNVPRSPFPAIRGKRIAVPGKLTTAYLVLQLYEKSKNKSPNSEPQTPYEVIFTPFDKIFDVVKSGEADYGLIIHEGQITYEQHGLELALDLGAWWHEYTGGLPLPLGVDVIRRDLGMETITAFAKLFKESIEYALNHRKEALEYASQFGRGISEDLNDRFVGMYVNDFTVELGAKGEAGFRRLMEEAYQHGVIPKRINLEFV